MTDHDGATKPVSATGRPRRTLAGRRPLPPRPLAIESPLRRGRERYDAMERKESMRYGMMALFCAALLSLFGMTKSLQMDLPKERQQLESTFHGLDPDWPFVLEDGRTMPAQEARRLAEAELADAEQSVMALGVAFAVAFTVLGFVALRRPLIACTIGLALSVVAAVLVSALAPFEPISRWDMATLSSVLAAGVIAARAEERARKAPQATSIAPPVPASARVYALGGDDGARP